MTDEREQRPLDLGIIRRLYGYTRPYARLRNALVVLVVARAIQLPLVTWAMARVMSGPVARRDVPGTVLGVLGFLALAALTEACFVFRSRFALRLGEAVVHDLRNQIHAHLLRMPMSFFGRTPVGRLVSRLTSDVDVVRVGVQDVAFVSTVQVGQAVISAALMVSYDWRLFLVTLVMVPGVWAIVRRLRGRLSQAYRDQQESFARVTTTLSEAVGGIRVIQGFARERPLADRFGVLINNHAAINMAAHRHAVLMQPFLELNGQLFLSIVLVVGGYQALVGDVPLAALIAFLFLANGLFAAIPNLGNQYNQALTAMAGAERVFTLLDTPPAWEDPPGAMVVSEVAGRIELEDVSFEYVAGRPVLSDVSVVVEPGKTLALVGPTGSGKSTLASLVAKLELPSHGRILVDGRDLRGVEGASFHRRVACVTQENFLFSGTVMENIRMGRPGATDDEVRAAVRALDLEEIVDALPSGLLSEVGEGGTQVSLGQRQVICFCRAMLADPRILILDEATSSIDALTELRLQAALARLLAGRTSVVIAHRLSTVRHADEVIVLDRGRVVERGTHRTLVAGDGIYAEMCRRLAGATAPGPSNGREWVEEV
jgi:ATP-binding cassette subfamily B protein